MTASACRGLRTWRRARSLQQARHENGYVNDGEARGDSGFGDTVGAEKQPDPNAHARQVTVTPDDADLSEDDLGDEDALEAWGYTRIPSLMPSHALEQLREAVVREVVDEITLERVIRDVRGDVAEALGPDRQALRQKNRARFGPADELTADQLDELVAAAGQLVVEFRSSWRYGTDYVRRASSDVMQSAQTTTSAIALLLRHGYVVDAEARWRGLHELACTAAFLAVDTDPTSIATRYLAHGLRLLPDDPAYTEQWAQGDFQDRSYEWLRESYPVTVNGKPTRFSQQWLFAKANLQSAPFHEWVRPSHGPSTWTALQSLLAVSRPVQLRQATTRDTRNSLGGKRHAR